MNKSSISFYQVLCAERVSQLILKDLGRVFFSRHSNDNVQVSIIYNDGKKANLDLDSFFHIFIMKSLEGAIDSVQELFELSESFLFKSYGSNLTKKWAANIDSNDKYNAYLELSGLYLSGVTFHCGNHPNDYHYISISLDYLQNLCNDIDGLELDMNLYRIMKDGEQAEIFTEIDGFAYFYNNAIKPLRSNGYIDSKMDFMFEGDLIEVTDQSSEKYLGRLNLGEYVMDDITHKGWYISLKYIMPLPHAYKYFSSINVIERYGGAKL